MHSSWHYFAAIVLLLGPTAVVAQDPAQFADAHFETSIHAANGEDSQGDPINNPVADPQAIVIFRNARFTVLTPQLIRMEWAADRKFEDHASLVFINRRLPVPKFSHRVEERGHKLILETDALTLTYMPTGDGHFTPDDLTISLTVDGKPTVWNPGTIDTRNLKGTARTLDEA